MHDRHAKARFFASGDAAYALRYHGNKESWVHGSIVEQTGPLAYIVRLDDGSVVRRHVDQLQRGITSPPVAPPTLRVPIERRCHHRVARCMTAVLSAQRCFREPNSPCFHTYIS